MLRSTLLLLHSLFICCFSLNAQERANTEIGVEAGVRLLSKARNVGLFLNAEPRLRVSSHASVGLRLSVTVNMQSYENADDTRYLIDEEFDDGFLSAVATFQYQWNERRVFRKLFFRPYLGLGMGPYLIANSVEVFDVSTIPPPDKSFEVPVNYKIGFLVRGGIQLRKSRLGLEYNLIPRSDVQLQSGSAIGTVNSSYLGLFVGFTI